MTSPSHASPVLNAGPTRPLQAWPARPETFLFAAAFAIVAILVLLPLFSIVPHSIYDDRAQEWTIKFFADVFSYPTVLVNTVLVGVLSTAIAVVLGGAIALILARTDAPTRGLLDRLVIIPIYITPLLTAIAWSWLGSPRSGFVNILIRDILGVDWFVLNLQSAVGVIAISGLSYVPLPYLLISSALRSMDNALEDSARVHGSSPLKTLKLVTLPLMTPAILGSALLVFVQALGLFSIAAVLGMPAGFYVATTEIYRLLDNYPPRLGHAAAWGMFLLLITVAIVLIQNRILGRRSYVTVTGKAFRPRILTLGLFRYPLAGLVWVYVFLSSLLPLSVILWGSLVSFLTADFDLMSFTFKHFNYVLFEYPKTGMALVNSLGLGAATATVVTALGLVVSWIIIRTKTPGRVQLEQVSMFPLSVPAMVFALGLLWTYVGIRFLPIYGTIWILLLAYVTHYLPIGIRATNTALRQLQPELEDAARISGASWSQSVRYVTFPLTRPTMIAAWMLLFIMAMQEVSASILLYTSQSVVLSVAVFDLWETGQPNSLAALSVIQLVVTFAVVAVLFRTRKLVV
jgi:iron(III) transport system permease protein